ncbi:response regulator [Pseudomonas sp. CCM 7893]|uniref:Response regulator n=1 Tax=Pseudomonas spelaei TaxID=1055469 RepID=A0A6I3WLS3_9PSED|nr:response regulator [Pseudomonas spelaei]MUF08313.1 response regulator [Pseudomonas spelaei]
MRNELGEKDMLPESFKNGDSSCKPIVLVAEDHPTNQELVRNQLEYLGFDCQIANNGNEALCIFNERIHCLLITDCNMPVMDGYTLARGIRVLTRGGNHFPILATTASIKAEEQQKCKDAGIDECLLKPLSLSALAQALNKWLPHYQDLSDQDSVLVSENDDWSTLLNFLGEYPSFVGLINGFIEVSRSDITRIEKLNFEDSQSIIEGLHHLRGGLRIFRLTELSARSARLEQQLMQGIASFKLDDFVYFLTDVRNMLVRMSSLLE